MDFRKYLKLKANFGKHLLFSVIGIILTSLVLEIICGVFWIVKEERLSSPAAIFQKKYGSKYIIKGCEWSDQLTFHPVLGFAYKGGSDCETVHTNNFHLAGSDIPLEKQTDVFTVLVLGGSVAETIAGHNDFESKKSVLQELVDKKYHSKEGKPIVFLNGSIGAGRQPMQLGSLNLFGALADSTISVEGYNESKLYLTRNAIYEVLPLWQELEVRDISSGQIYDVSMGVRKIIVRWYLKRLPSYSYLGLTIFSLCTDSLKALAAESPTKSPYPRLPDEWDTKKLQKVFIDRYSAYLSSMDEVSKIYGNRLTLFLQPAPALERKLTDQELNIVGDLSYGIAYREMLDQLISKNRKSIHMIDLTAVFKNVRDQIYIDPIHNNKIGKEILADAILKNLAREYNWKKNP